ncbi:MAG: LysR family transcriptional regulator [Pseudomonadota bacterium]
MKQPRHIQQADLRLLRVFQTIVQSGGIAAAEMVLNVGRSTISRQLSDLELRLGVKLCDRGPGGFALTEEGTRIFDAANNLLSSVDNFTVEVNEINDRLVGRLSIALFDMTLTNPEAQVASALRAFDDIAPDVDLQVRILGTDATERGILNDEIHVGIIPTHRKSTSLDYYPLYNELMYLYCGQTHPWFSRDDDAISPKEIREARFAGLEFHSPNMAVSQKERLNHQAQVNDQEALAILIQSGRYVGFLPDHFAHPYEEQKVVRKVRPDRYRYEIEFSAIVKHHPTPSRIARAFLQCLRDAHSDEGA